MWYVLRWRLLCFPEQVGMKEVGLSLDEAVGDRKAYL
jgi:hypothetical protein